MAATEVAIIVAPGERTFGHGFDTTSMALRPEAELPLLLLHLESPTTFTGWSAIDEVLLAEGDTPPAFAPWWLFELALAATDVVRLSGVKWCGPAALTLLIIVFSGWCMGSPLGPRPPNVL